MSRQTDNSFKELRFKAPAVKLLTPARPVILMKCHCVGNHGFQNRFIGGQLDQCLVRTKLTSKFLFGSDSSAQ